MENYASYSFTWFDIEISIRIQYINVSCVSSSTHKQTDTQTHTRARASSHAHWDTALCVSGIGRNYRRFQFNMSNLHKYKVSIHIIKSFWSSLFTHIWAFVALFSIPHLSAASVGWSSFVRSLACLVDCSPGPHTPFALSVRFRFDVYNLYYMLRLIL